MTGSVTIQTVYLHYFKVRKQHYTGNRDLFHNHGFHYQRQLDDNYVELLVRENATNLIIALVELLYNRKIDFEITSITDENNEPIFKLAPYPVQHKLFDLFESDYYLIGNTKDYAIVSGYLSLHKSLDELAPRCKQVGEKFIYKCLNSELQYVETDYSTYTNDLPFQYDRYNSRILLDNL